MARVQRHTMTEPIDCHNCGQRLTGPFCHACGQKAAPLDPSLRAIAHDFVQEVLSLDGRIFQSARKLFLSPGFLTLEYIRGRRMRWMAPLRLYLVFSVVYFGLNAVAPNPNVRVGVTVTGPDQETAAELKKYGFNSEQELEQKTSEVLAAWTPRLMFVLVPFFALLVQLAARRSGLHYPQHLYFALHVHAAWFAVGALAALFRLVFGRDSVVAAIAGVLVLVYAFAYLVLAFRRAYGGRLRLAVVRAAGVGFVYFLAIGIATAAVIVPVVFRRGFTPSGP